MGHLVESKAAAAESLEEEKENAEREETDEKVGEGGVNTRNSSIARSFSTPLLSFSLHFAAWVVQRGTETPMRSTWRPLLLKRLTSATTSSFKTF